MEFYHSRVTELGELFDGVPEMLETLKEQGYTLALLSDKGEVYGTRELESMGIGGLFDYVLFMTGGRAYKPDPAGLRQVMDALSVGKDQALYVGDSHVDVQCARRTGVASAAALWGSLSVDQVLSEGPDYALESVADVVATVTARA